MTSAVSYFAESLGVIGVVKINKNRTSSIVARPRDVTFDSHDGDSAADQNRHDTMYNKTNIAL